MSELVTTRPTDAKMSRSTVEVPAESGLGEITRHLGEKVNEIAVKPAKTAAETVKVVPWEAHTEAEKAFVGQVADAVTGTLATMLPRAAEHIGKSGDIKRWEMLPADVANMLKAADQLSTASGSPRPSERMVNQISLNNPVPLDRLSLATQLTHEAVGSAGMSPEHVPEEVATIARFGIDALGKLNHLTGGQLEFTTDEAQSMADIIRAGEALEQPPVADAA